MMTNAPVANSRGKCAAFTLIETIGVLAVIAVLASLLMPKVFEAISNARMERTVAGLRTIKTATVEHYAKFGSLASSNGATLPFSGSYTNYDAILLAEGLIDKPFSTSIGTNAFIRILSVSGLGSDAEVDGSNGAYDLNGDGDNDVVGASHVIEAVFLNVSPKDAISLNDRVDGAGLGVNSGGNDFKGRVMYHRPTPSKPQLRVYLYITHQ